MKLAACICAISLSSIALSATSHELEFAFLLALVVLVFVLMHVATRGWQPPSKYSSEFPPAIEDGATRALRTPSNSIRKPSTTGGES
jgi:hypothetical protein